MSHTNRQELSHAVEGNPRATLANPSSASSWSRVASPGRKEHCVIPPWQMAPLYQDTWFIVNGFDLEI